MKNGAFKIEKGIPLPPKRMPHGETVKALRELKVGDSFLYPKKKRGGITSHAQRCGIKVVTREVDETTVRIWRVA